MEIGSHGLRHVSLPKADDEELTEELTRGRSLLEDLTGGPVTGFAYPYGHVSRREVNAVRKAGYEYACAIWRSLLSGDHALPRTRMGDRDRGMRMWAKAFRHQIVWRTRV
jgi:peptidoglycan/xylan/chitin deacetylase (PgdA/CDA1 family)